MNKESILVECADGVKLKGMLLIPENPKAVVQLNGGTAVKKEFYLPFLSFLYEHGFICCLWDYRGSGESVSINLKNCDFTLRDYGLQDIPAIKKYLRSRFCNYPFLIIGHSVGGQQIGFIDELTDIKGMLAFAVSTGHLSGMPLIYRLQSIFFFYIFTPISIATSGYVKAKKFNIMEDLPKNVVIEWRSWCKKSDYFFNPDFYGKTVPIKNFKNYSFPIHVYSATDDPIATPVNIKHFWNNIKSAHPINFESLSPAALKVSKIGHLGFFRKEHKNKLWQMALSKLNEFISQ